MEKRLEIFPKTNSWPSSTSLVITSGDGLNDGRGFCMPFPPTPLPCHTERDLPIRRPILRNKSNKHITFGDLKSVNTEIDIKCLLG